MIQRNIGMSYFQEKTTNEGAPGTQTPQVALLSCLQTLSSLPDKFTMQASAL